MKGLRIVVGFVIVLIALFTHTTSYASTRVRTLAETTLNDPSVRIAAGAFHACQLQEDGTVRCWGTNVSGQLGDGGGPDRSTPAPVIGITGAVAITAGGAHTCALLANGTVRCWGDSFFGQVGDGFKINRPTPVAVIGLTNVVAIAGGKEHTCALLASGVARCWGSNTDGKLGNLNTLPQGNPVAVLNVDGTQMTNIVSMAAGADHTCALFANGTARCWGTSSGGRLGFATPGGPVSGLQNAIAITAGTAHTCALVTGGFVSCWGSNPSGQLGNNSTLPQSLPGFVAGLPAAVAITAGAEHTCALMADGTARCWGSNLTGQIGDGFSGTNRLTSRIVLFLNNAVAIVAGGLPGAGSHTCALLANGSAQCWGANTFGQLGNGTFTSSFIPSSVLGSGGSITARDIAAGRNHTCAVRANGTVSCWGSNGSGQIGDGTSGVNRLSPVAVVTSPGVLLTNVVAIAAGEAHTCAVQADGIVRCWGDNSSGQLGDGTLVPKLTPVVVPGLFRVVAIAAGGALGSSHTCALVAEGGIFCWGANGSGQLGDGTFTPRPGPTLVQNLSNAVSIAVGELHSCALLADGTPRCWGANNNGQLGDGSLTPKNVPTFVSFTNAVAIAGGNLHTCALRADGSSWCWGANLLGQLGINSTVSPQTGPRLVVDITNAVVTSAVGIAGGFGHSCAILASGGARCWGSNGSGELGDGSTTQRLTPVVVTRPSPLIQISGVTAMRTFGPIVSFTLANAVQITTGRRHSCALTGAGAVFCWGENIAGQLGVNSTANQTAAVAVPSFTLNIDPAVSLKHNDRSATVTILAACDEGQRLHVDVTLSQGDASGSGNEVGECTGGLERYPVKVHARGRNDFEEGPADAEAHAVIKERGIEVDSPEWTRRVQILELP